MVPFFVLGLIQTTAPLAGQEETRPVPAQVVYDVKIEEGHKLVSSPKIRTLDEQSATISVGDGNPAHGYSVQLLPKVQADGSVTNTLHLTYAGVTYPGLELKVGNGKTNYVAFSKPEHAKVRGHTEESLSWRTGAANSVTSARKGEILIKLTVKTAKS